MPRLDDMLGRASPEPEDAQWFEVNYAPLRPEIRKHLKAELGDHYTALDDVEQVVMLRVWLEGRKKYNPDRASVKTWIKRVASSEALVYVQMETKKAKAERATFGQLKLRWMIQQNEDIWAHTTWTFQEIVDCLPPDLQEVLILRVYYRMSMTDTALTLGKRRATVEKLYDEALQEARRWIEDEDVSDLRGGEAPDLVLRQRVESGRPDLDMQDVLKG
jgi:RNA polymerase sigma factor (sigma-70 family)